MSIFYNAFSLFSEAVVAVTWMLQRSTNFRTKLRYHCSCFNVKKKSSVGFQRVHHTSVSFDHLLLCRQLYFSNEVHSD